MPNLRNSMRVPDEWTGGPNRWSREERDKWRAFCLDPKGGDPEAGAGSRGRPVSHGSNAADIDELYERMVARGLVVREVTLADYYASIPITVESQKGSFLRTVASKKKARRK